MCGDEQRQQQKSKRAKEQKSKRAKDWASPGWAGSRWRAGVLRIEPAGAVSTQGALIADAG